MGKEMEDKRHILIVDDNEAIHKDIESILLSSSADNDDELKQFENELFDTDLESNVPFLVHYDIDHAFQGADAVEMVDVAEKKETPYSLIFMDVRMPPGIDGVQAIKKIWENHPNIEIVICTAYSDYTWEQIMGNLGVSDKLLFMKKPFDATALKQTALSITAKWKLQQESLNYTEKLEKEVDKRTAELNDLLEKYKEMKEKAERATKTKSEFLAKMSHEIRTPMNGVMAMNELLLDTDLTDEQQEYCDLAEQSAQTLLQIINDLLDFSKLEAKKMESEQIPVNVKEIVEGVAKIIRISAKEKQLDVEYNLTEKIPAELIGDPTKIRQILMNYGNNAVKFTSSGTVRFDVELVEKNEQKFKIKLSVSDTGIGISSEKIKHLFQPFSQADSAVYREHGGTGLGLAICKQLAELMGGEVGVESEYGKGSTFWATIDLKSDESIVGKAGNGEEKNKDADDKQSLPPLKVLVAEDNEVNRIVIQRMLEKEGCNPHFVNNGLDALETAKEQDFDLILMDLQMPGMNGLDVTAKIRESEKQSNTRIPIVALTASYLSGDKEKCLEYGMDDFLTKPLERINLNKVLQKWSKTSQSDHQACL